MYRNEWSKEADGHDIRRKTCNGPESAIPWSLILDRTEDEDMTKLQKMAMVLDAFLRTDSVGFGNVHLGILNDPDSDDVSWEPRMTVTRSICARKADGIGARWLIRWVMH